MNCNYLHQLPDSVGLKSSDYANFVVVPAHLKSEGADDSKVLYGGRIPPVPLSQKAVAAAALAGGIPATVAAALAGGIPATAGPPAGGHNCLITMPPPTSWEGKIGFRG